MGQFRKFFSTISVNNYLRCRRAARANELLRLSMRPDHEHRRRHDAQIRRWPERYARVLKMRKEVIR